MTLYIGRGVPNMLEIEMSDTLDWKDGKSHRDPKWPIGGYAPGGYLIRCLRCGDRFDNMDKCAIHCFPCAVESLRDACEAQRDAIRTLQGQNATLLSAISIKQAVTAHSEKGEE